MRNKSGKFNKHGTRPARGRKHGHGVQKVQKISPSDFRLRRAILSFLKRKKTPQKTIDIAHGCGYKTTKEVNPTIYGLQKKHVVIKVKEAPPTWKLDEQNTEMMCWDESEEETASSSRKSTASTSNRFSSPQPQQQSENSPFTSQEIKLFGTHGESLFEENNVDESTQVESTLENIHLHNEQIETEGEKMEDANNSALGVRAEEDDSDEEDIYSSKGYSVQERLADLMATGPGNAYCFDDSNSLSDSPGQEYSDPVDISEHTYSDNQETSSELVAIKSEPVELAQKSTESSENPQSSTYINMDGMETTETKLSFENQVLLHLSNRPLSTAVLFVLVKEMKFSQEEVEDALKALEEKKLVSRTGSVWQVTKTGDDLLQSMGYQNKKSPPVNSARDEKSVFHSSKTGIGRGIPLSPLELACSVTGFGRKDAVHSVGRGLQLKMAIELTKMANFIPDRGRSTLTSNSGELESRRNNSLGIRPGSSYVFPSPGGRNMESPPQQEKNQKLSQQTNIGFHIPASPATMCGQQAFSSKVLVNPPVSSYSFGSPQLDRQQQLNKPHEPNVTGTNQFGSNPVNAGMLTNFVISSESFAALNKNPISALMEYAQSRHSTAKIEVIRQSGPPHKPNFEIACFVGNRKFPSVNCQNKKDGRKEAADVAMRTLIAEGAYKVTETSSLVNIASTEMTHFDRVAALVHHAFNALIASIPEALAGRKIIAGLVMKRHANDIGVVISIGSGNRCITGQQLSLEGNTVNDSHAEIITRRGFVRFLYKQLESYDPSKKNGLFEKGSTGKLRIRPNITFHLYISTAPCGDGALFSPRDTGTNNAPLDNVTSREHHPTFTSTVQGLLRTKMEGGEGTIPIESDFVEQTFDGIVRGERLRTMSCTDKICRWNVVGMQGALLSHFIEPVYLDSLTLGFLYDHGHLARAVCCRVNRTGQPIDELLPTGYHLNHPWLGRVTACDPSRETQKTKNLSINWSFGDQQPEVIDGPLGLCNTGVEKGFFSRVTKKNLYESFKRVCVKFSRTDLAVSENYHKAKMAATDFQKAKTVLQQKLKENKYGPWVSKPVEEEMFS